MATGRHRVFRSQRPDDDPIFQAHSDGVIIYDRSGWMSAQIFDPTRAAMKEPGSRTEPGVVTTADTQAKAAAFDTYYAYFGTRELNTAASKVTHHIQASRLPYETASDKVRDVKFDGQRLKLIVHETRSGETHTRTLTWERITTAP